MKLYKYNLIKRCRLCKSDKIKKIISFGNVGIGNNFNKSVNISKKSSKYPLGINYCNKCSHCQLNISVNPRILYKKNYTYLSGTADSFKLHFKNYYQWVVNKIKLPESSVVLDIGSNDGTCLSFFQKKYKVCGIDPALKPSQIANKNNIFTINDYLNHNSSQKILKKFGNIDLITSHNVLAHIDNNLETFKIIYKLLKPKGYFCFEIGYFLKVVQNNYFDTIYHEHLDYYNANSLVKFLCKLNFSIIDITVNPSQGGSLRILCRKNNKIYISKSVNNFLANEIKSNILNYVNLIKWKKRIINQVEELNKIIHYHKNSNIIAYGAPTKSTLWIKLLHLNSQVIKFVVDDNNLKINKYYPNTDIKIQSVKILKKVKIDLIIIFAWNFKDDIIIKLKKMNLKNIKIVTPLPKMKIDYL